MTFLELNDVSYSYGGSDELPVLEHLNLTIEENEFIAVIGFSGAGKSTLVSLLAGLLLPATGQIRLKGKPITEPGPELGIVFQNYSLLPWLTVFGNIELAVRRVFPHLDGRARRQHVQHYIDLVNLTTAEWKRPHELSGGMRQRLSLARTLSMRPSVLLLDEPLSALDALTRAVLQDEIVRLWEEDRRTVVMITNDVDEAVLMADRLIPLTPGPQATFGSEFQIGLPRPRDRAALNFCTEFKEIRNRVTKYLVGLNTASQESRSLPRVTLPEIEPILPKAG